MILADLLSRRGRRVVVLERQPHFSPIPRGEIIQPNGLGIFQRLDLLDEVQARGPHRNHIFHFLNVDGRRLCTIDYRMLPPPFNYCLILLPEIVHQALLKRLGERENVKIVWGAEVSGLAREGGRVVGVGGSNRLDGGSDFSLRAALVVGADGVYSRVREVMDVSYRLKVYSHGYRTMLVRRPEAFGSAGRYYVGRKQILGLFPVSDACLYLLYLVEAPGGPDETGREGEPRGLDRLKRDIVAVEPLLRDSLEEIVSWDQVGYMPCRRVRAKAWGSDGVVLMGDAAHAMNPHASQGRNQAMEDALALDAVIQRCFESGDFTWKALRSYEDSRRESVERLQRLADQQVMIWNAGDPVRTWLRDRVFRVIDRNPRLRYKMLSQVAGLDSRPYALLDYVKAAGFLPDPSAQRLEH